MPTTKMWATSAWWPALLLSLLVLAPAGAPAEAATKLGGVVAALIQEPEALLPSAFPGAAGRGSSSTTVQMCSRWWLRSRDAWGVVDG